MKTKVYTGKAEPLTAEDMVQMALAETDPNDQKEIEKLAGILAQMSFDKELAETQVDAAGVLKERMGWDELVDLQGIFPLYDFAVVQNGQITALLYTTIRGETYDAGAEVPIPLSVFAALQSFTKGTPVKTYVGLSLPSGVFVTELKDAQVPRRVTMTAQGVDAKNPFPGPSAMIPWEEFKETV